MNNLILIAAIGENNELGKDNKLIWYLPNDLKFFKSKTLNKTIVMGYNTFCSLPKLLPNRKHIVLTHRDIDVPDEVRVFHDKDELLESLRNEKDVYIIGGASIYRQYLPYANKMYLTEIHKVEPEADSYFPKFNHDEWEREVIESHMEEEIPYEHILYKKR